MVKFEKLLDDYLVPLIYVIIGIKALFLLSALSNIFLTKIVRSDKLIQMFSHKLETIKHQTEFAFIFLTSILMIAIFNPRENNMKYINHHVKLLFFLFGIILIVTAKWSLFFHESIITKQITNSLK